MLFTNVLIDLSCFLSYLSLCINLKTIPFTNQSHLIQLPQVMNFYLFFPRITPVTPNATKRALIVYYKYSSVPIGSPLDASIASLFEDIKYEGETNILSFSFHLSIDYQCLNSKTAVIYGKVHYVVCVLFYHLLKIRSIIDLSTLSRFYYVLIFP